MLLSLRGHWPQFSAMQSKQILQRQMSRILRGGPAANSPPLRPFDYCLTTFDDSLTALTTAQPSLSDRSATAQQSTKATLSNAPKRPFDYCWTTFDDSLTAFPTACPLLAYCMPPELSPAALTTSPAFIASRKRGFTPRFC